MALDDFPADSDVVHTSVSIGDGSQVLTVLVQAAEAFVAKGPLNSTCEGIGSVGDVEAAPLVHAPDLALGHLEGTHVELVVGEGVAAEGPIGDVPSLGVLLFRLWLISEVLALDR